MGFFGGGLGLKFKRELGVGEGGGLNFGDVEMGGFWIL